MMKHLYHLILPLLLLTISGIQPGYGQDRNGKITLDLDNVPLSRVLDEIEAQTAYIFISSGIDLDRPVSLSVKDATIHQTMEKLCKGRDFTWSLSGVNITLSKVTGPSNDKAPFLVRGTVSDADGPVPGAVVMVENDSARAAVTGGDGTYSLECDPDAVLVASCLGYNTQSVPVAGRHAVDILLTVEMTSLEETVVVGYRTVKKISLTGAVSTISLKEKENQPISNTSQLFYSTPGVFVNQGGAKPGADAASITIRGVNSLNATGGSPLVLLDGVEYDLSSIDPDNIESISVLKDVSAAIYGLKAANGVILITSKKGRVGTPKVDFRAKYGIQQVTQIPNVVTDPILYMKMRNLAEINSGVAPDAVTYSQKNIQEYQEGMAVDPVLYPASDWYDICLHDGQLQQYNVRVTGGKEKLTYSLGVGYMNQKGVMIGDDFARRLSYDMKLGADITEWLHVNAAYQGSFRRMYAPGYGTEANFNTLARAIPIFANHEQDGLWYTTWLSTPGRNHPEIPTMYLTGGFTNTKYQDNLVSAGVTIKAPFDILYVSNVSYRKQDTFQKNHRTAYYGVNPKTGEVDSGYVAAVTSPFVTDKDAWYAMVTQSQQLSWMRDFGPHNVHLMVGQEYQYVSSSGFSAGNKDFNDNTLVELDAKGKDYTYATVTGSSYKTALVSFFGRAAYSYDERYLFEVTGRYDGSSKLAKANRWHFFPSVSLAWNISKEPFFHAPAIDVLKLRTSYGIMGSESVSTYAYFMTVDAVSQTYSFGGNSATGYAVSQLTDTTLGWEKTASFDLGLDLMAWKGKLNFEADGFYKKTYDIIMTRAIPAHLGGLAGPKSNVGTVRNIGFEVSASWRDDIGKNFHYGINASATFVRNKVIYLNDGTIFANNNTLITKENYPIRSFYVLEADGFYESYDEINAAEAVYGDRSALRPGYVKYVDQNDDGVIDNDDKIITRNSIPELTYSFGLSLGWKNISLDAQFQGIGDCYLYLTGNLATPFNNGAGVTRNWATDSWTSATKDSATLPLLTTSTDAPMNFLPSTQWLYNLKYLRLKNLQLSYSFPKSLLSHIRLSSLQVYVAAQNVLTFTDFKLYDPEFTSTNTNLYQDYPNLKTYSVGINLSF